jgi:hypothetical protein
MTRLSCVSDTGLRVVCGTYNSYACKVRGEGVVELLIKLGLRLLLPNMKNKSGCMDLFRPTVASTAFR